MNGMLFVFKKWLIWIRAEFKVLEDINSATIKS